MLVGQVAALREKRPEDVAVLHGLVAADPAFHALVDTKPWRPVEIDAARARFDEVVRERSTPDSAVQFAVQSATDNAGRCQGWATVWDLDLHNRTAHLGLGLVPGARGKGMGVDVLRLLCRYAFEVRDLVRVQVETLASNEPMRRAALAAGFTQEGVLRSSAYVMGRRDDDVVLGLLREEYEAARG